MGDGQSLQRLAEIPVQEVKRIGDKRAESLAALGITSVLDLITHYPRRYIDRSRQADVVGWPWARSLWSWPGSNR